MKFKLLILAISLALSTAADAQQRKKTSKVKSAPKVSQVKKETKEKDIVVDQKLAEGSIGSTDPFLVRSDLIKRFNGSQANVMLVNIPSNEALGSTLNKVLPVANFLSAKQNTLISLVPENNKDSLSENLKNPNVTGAIVSLDLLSTAMKAGASEPLVKSRENISGVIIGLPTKNEKNNAIYVGNLEKLSTAFFASKGMNPLLIKGYSVSSALESLLRNEVSYIVVDREIANVLLSREKGRVVEIGQTDKVPAFFVLGRAAVYKDNFKELGKMLEGKCLLQKTVADCSELKLSDGEEVFDELTVEEIQKLASTFDKLGK